MSRFYYFVLNTFKINLITLLIREYFLRVYTSDQSHSLSVPRGFTTPLSFSLDRKYEHTIKENPAV